VRTQNPLESEIAELMVSALNLQNITARQINPKQSLTDGDLAMDSIDVLELSLAISKMYSIQIESDNSDWRDAFVNLEALAKLVKTKQAG